MKRTTIKLLLLGDEFVGKTSLICAIISEMSGDPVKVMKKVILPPDMCAYSKEVFTQLIDTGPQTDIKSEVLSCQLILLVYDVSSPQSVMRLQEHWLPIISSISRDVPILLVGNKHDKIELQLQKSNEYIPVRQIMVRLVRRYKQIQMGIECSAYYDRNVKKVLGSAQRAVLYPLSPLYDLSLRQITPKFKKALTRIFRILDRDLTGRLSDLELSSLQERVFQTELSADDVTSIKHIIQKEEGQDKNQASISVGGFIAFQKKFIQMLKIQICWSILRHFKYDNALDLKPAQEQQLVIDESIGEGLCLTSAALDFLQRIYAFALRSKKENQSAMAKLFECSPKIPFQQFQSQPASLQEFILHWYVYAFMGYRQCYRAMLYLGYELSLQQTFQKIKGKSTYSDLLRLRERSVVSILIIENEEYHQLIDEMFRDGVQEGILTRKAYLHSNKDASKVIILFKINPKHLNQFFTANQLKNRQISLQYRQISQQYRFDLIIHFQQKDAQRLNMLNIPSHTMIRMISRSFAEKELKLFDMSELDLQKVPVGYKPEVMERWLACLIDTFEKIQLGYKKEKLEEMKSQSEKFRNIVIGVASVIGAIGVGAFAYFRRINLGG